MIAKAFSSGGSCCRTQARSSPSACTPSPTDGPVGELPSVLPSGAVPVPFQAGVASWSVCKAVRNGAPSSVHTPSSPTPHPHPPPTTPSQATLPSLFLPLGLLADDLVPKDSSPLTFNHLLQLFSLSCRKSGFGHWVSLASPQFPHALQTGGWVEVWLCPPGWAFFAKLSGSQGLGEGDWYRIWKEQSQ